MKQTAQEKANTKWRNGHLKHSRYLSNRTKARTFIRKYAKVPDVYNLINVWNQNHYQQLALKKRLTR